MSAYTDRLRETALADCQHPDDELCEHRSAALAYTVITQGPSTRFDLGALLAWLAIALVCSLMFALAVVQLWRAL